MNKENGSLLEMFPDCYLKTLFSDEVILAFHTTSEIYEMARKEKISLARAMKN